MNESAIRKKSFEFALLIIEIYKKMIKQNEFVLSKQLLRSGTSIGANIEEGLAGQTRKDFIAKFSIASKEARETKYWLLLLSQSKFVELNLDRPLKDIEEIIKLLTAIVKTSQSR
ncbi:MAG: four helix bundle protein [Saprospiraceae bacterium]|nr:four helix bundle protein [Saprospiraceae bacterium]